ncbi:MAG: hypothetical protein ACPLPV_08910, partial [Methanomassiliicoccales archaeon]
HFSRRITRDDFPLVEGIRLILILTLLLTAWFTNASATPLAYDNGGAEFFWSDYYPNGIAVKFTPPAYRWKVTAILIYGFAIDKGEKSFLVELRDKARALGGDTTNSKRSQRHSKVANAERAQVKYLM